MRSSPAQDDSPQWISSDTTAGHPAFGEDNELLFNGINIDRREQGPQGYLSGQLVSAVGAALPPLAGTEQGNAADRHQPPTSSAACALI